MNEGNKSIHFCTGLSKNQNHVHRYYQSKVRGSDVRNLEFMSVIMTQIRSEANIKPLVVESNSTPLTIPIPNLKQFL